MSRAPGLIIRLGLTFLRFKRKAKKDARILRKSLVKNGMDKDMAKELADAYAMQISIRKLFKGQGAEFPFNFFD